MLLHPDPQTYWPLLGIKSKTSFLLGPRRSGVGGNDALFKAVQKLNRREWRNIDRTIEKMLSYLRAGGNQRHGSVNIPENFLQSLDTALKKTPKDIDELWTPSLIGLEKGLKVNAPRWAEEFDLSRMKMWCPYLSSEKIWRERISDKGWEFRFDLIRELEFSDSKSIQVALSQLTTETDDKLTQQSMTLVSYSVLLFVAACADADLNLGEGNSVIERFFPRVDEGLVVPPLRHWMKHAKQIMGVETQKETWNILLGHLRSSGSREKEGKKLWAYGGEYEPLKSKSKMLYLPSNNQFTKMAIAATKYVEERKPENVQYVNDLRKCSAFVIFLSKLYDKLADLNSNRERMLLFDDYPYFYEIAQTTKGPPPRMHSGG